MTGVLSGIRIVEIAGLGPAPFCGMMLADHGAEVIRIERAGADLDPYDVLARTRTTISLDLKCESSVEIVRMLCRTSDGLIEGFRPGVMERLGLGPEVLLQDNPSLVYGRMTGWGQDGPLAQSPGHDINYIALSGALHTVGVQGGKPVPPVNYIGDFGGGGLLLAFGMVAAILDVQRGGRGQVVDAAMFEGASLLTSGVRQMLNQGLWVDMPGSNFLDGGAHFYETYECADGKWIAVGALEPQFYKSLLTVLGLDRDEEFFEQNDPESWPRLKEKLCDIFKSCGRDDWIDRFNGTDACVVPVLSLHEATAHPHSVARGAFVNVSNQIQPAPAPRFSETPAVNARRAHSNRHEIFDFLQKFGYNDDEISVLRGSSESNAGSLGGQSRASE